jgi:hypothetical protein
VPIERTRIAAAPRREARVGPSRRAAPNGPYCDPSWLGHGVADEHDLAAHRVRRRRLEGLHAAVADDFGLDPTGRRCAAIAECGDGEWLREGAMTSARSSPRTHTGMS